MLISLIKKWPVRFVYLYISYHSSLNVCLYISSFLMELCIANVPVYTGMIILNVVVD